VFWNLILNFLADWESFQDNKRHITLKEFIDRSLPVSYRNWN